jgi:hypothetical protein
MNFSRNQKKLFDGNGINYGQQMGKYESKQRYALSCKEQWLGIN